MPGPLSLKQRLQALSTNIANGAQGSSSGDSFSLNSPKSPGPRIRAFLSQNIMRRPQEQFNGNTNGNGNGHGNEQGYSESQDRVQEVMSRLIFQAGVDYETRPMVVMSASALPDPREVNYDLLLARILSYLNLYVESDYTVVFFAAGGRHKPDWNWVWKAYRSLSRKYRKNLKRLYIVHSNFFTKMLFSLAGAIISPKFFRKITYIDTLSELAYHVPLTQIDIPPAVYHENLKHERQINLPVHQHADLFGVPLEELMGYNGEKGGVPRVVKDCIQFLRSTGMQEEGLFRRSPNSALLRQVQEAYDRGHVVSLETFGDPHLAAVLLKKYLRDLPDPIFPESIYPLIKRCPTPTSDPSDMSSISFIRDTLLPELLPCSYILLNHIFHLLHEVSLRSASNRMDAHNLAVVICPNLVSGSNPLRDVMLCAVPGGPSLHSIPTQPQPPRPSTPSTSNPAALTEGKTTLGLVVKLCIQRYYEIFDDLPDPTEALPQDPNTQEIYAPPSSSSIPSPQHHINRDSMIEDDEDIDDAMLVMPIGPAGNSRNPPTAWSQPGAGTSVGVSNSSSFGTVRGRHKSTPSKDAAQSVFAGSSNGTPYSSYSHYTPNKQGTTKAKSMISFEKGPGYGGTSRRGSIAIGRGTMGKSMGSGVVAAGITAEGFFSPPPTAPPVPSLSNK